MKPMKIGSPQIKCILKSEFIVRSLDLFAEKKTAKQTNNKTEGLLKFMLDLKKFPLKNLILILSQRTFTLTT